MRDEQASRQTAYALYSPVYFGLACNAIEHTSYSRPQSLVAIVFAALALEAFVNELQYMAASHEGSDPASARLAAALKGEGKRPPPLIVRLDLIAQHYPDERDCEDWGATIAEARLLITLRNALAHHKVEEHAWTSEDEPYRAPPPDLLSQLHARDLISSPLDRGPRPWVDAIQTRRVAIWAYNSAAQTMHEVFRRLPVSALALKLRFLVEQIPALDQY